MPKLQQNVTVTAPAARVWAVLEDVTALPALTPSMTSVEVLTPGPLAVGSRYRITQPRLGRSVWEVTEVEPGRSFTWVSRRPGVTTAGRHVLTPHDDATTGLRLEIEHTDPLARPAARLTSALTRRYLTLEATGLKAAAETT